MAPFLATLGWFLQATVRQQPWQVLALLVASAAGLASLSAGLAWLYLVFGALESGSVATFGPLSFSPYHRLALAGAAMPAAGLVLLGGFGLFVARYLAVIISERWHTTIVDTVMCTPAPLLDNPSGYRSEAALRQHLLRLATAEARSCVLAMRRGLEVPLPVIIALIGFGGLLLLQPTAAILGGVVALAFAPLTLRVQAAGVAAGERYQAALPAERHELDALLRARSEPAASASGPPPDAPATPHTATAIRAFRERVMAALQADLLGQALAAISTFVLLWYLGSGYLAGDLNLTLIGSFMVLLRIVLGAVRNAMVGIASVTRYHTAMERYRHFVTLQRVPEAPASGMPALRLQRAEHAVHEPGIALPDVVPLATWAITTPIPPSLLGLGYYATLLAEDEAEVRGWRGAWLSNAPIELLDARKNPNATAPEWNDGTRPRWLWFPGKPSAGTHATFHLTTDTHGRVVSWGSLRWARAHWSEIHASLQANHAAANGLLASPLAEDEGE